MIRKVVPLKRNENLLKLVRSLQTFIQKNNLPIPIERHMYLTEGLAQVDLATVGEFDMTYWMACFIHPEDENVIWSDVFDFNWNWNYFHKHAWYPGQGRVIKFEKPTYLRHYDYTEDAVFIHAGRMDWSTLLIRFTILDKKQHLQFYWGTMRELSPFIEVRDVIGRYISLEELMTRHYEKWNPPTPKHRI